MTKPSPTAQLEGAHAFYADGCANCHSGARTSPTRSRATLGCRSSVPAKASSTAPSPPTTSAGATSPSNAADRYAFRPPPLTNVELTGPWGHAGQYKDLDEFIEHYDDPTFSLTAYDITEHVAESEAYLWDMFYENRADVLATLHPSDPSRCR